MCRLITVFSSAHSCSCRPPDHEFWNYDPLLIREREGQRERFIWWQGPIVGESPPSTGEIPHRALFLEWSCVVRDGALPREATVGMNRKRHGGGSNRTAILGGWLGEGNAYPLQHWYFGEARNVLPVSEHSLGAEKKNVSGTTI